MAETGESECVPFKCYRTWWPSRRGGGGEWKYFAPGMGGSQDRAPLRRRKARGRGPDQPPGLTPRGLSELSDEALKLDRNAPLQASDVFGDAAAAKRELFSVNSAARGCAIRRVTGGRVMTSLGSRGSPGLRRARKETRMLRSTRRQRRFALVETRRSRSPGSSAPPRRGPTARAGESPRRAPCSRSSGLTWRTT